MEPTEYSQCTDGFDPFDFGMALHEHAALEESGMAQPYKDGDVLWSPQPQQQLQPQQLQQHQDILPWEQQESKKQASFLPVSGSLPPSPMHHSEMPPVPSPSDSSGHLFYNPYIHASAGSVMQQSLVALPLPLEERGAVSSQALLDSQEQIRGLQEQLAKNASQRLAYDAVIQSLRQELDQRNQTQQNQDVAPTWQHAQASLRAALGDNDFTLTADTLKFLVDRPIQALQVCKALGKIPAREKDMLTHHMRFFYGSYPNGYSENTWNTWYGYMWRLLRWIGAYAAGTMLPVDTAAHHIEQLEARYINGENISFENWNRKKVGTPREEALKASNRLQGNFLIAWNVSGQRVDDGYRQLDRIEQLVQGCDVQV